MRIPATIRDHKSFFILNQQNSYIQSKNSFTMYKTIFVHKKSAYKTLSR